MVGNPHLEMFVQYLVQPTLSKLNSIRNNNISFVIFLPIPSCHLKLSKHIRWVEWMVGGPPFFASYLKAGLLVTQFYWFFSLFLWEKVWKLKLAKILLISKVTFYCEGFSPVLPTFNNTKNWEIVCCQTSKLVRSLLAQGSFSINEVSHESAKVGNTACHCELFAEEAAVLWHF